MACSKNGCESVMCDTYVPGVGYVCFDCQARFKAFLDSRGVHPQTHGELKALLHVFMETEMTEETPVVDIDEFFQSHTR